MTDKHNNTKKIGWTIFLNIVITLAEYIGGMLSGSLALLSDAGHNLSDVISLILGYFGEKISDKKATKTHTFGFKRVEIFTASINALSLLVIAVLIVTESIKRISHPENISLGIMLSVGAIGLFGNLFSILILNKEKNASLNMKAAYLHMFYDTLSSVFVIAAAVIIYFTNMLVIDTVLSLIIALMILYSSLEIIKKTIHIFMQGIPEGIEFDKVFETISKIKDVKSIHDLHIWSVNSNQNFLSCHICTGKIKNPDILLKRINAVLKSSFNIEHTAIQFEQNNICKTGAICCK